MIFSSGTMRSLEPQHMQQQAYFPWLKVTLLSDRTTRNDANCALMPMKMHGRKKRTGQANEAISSSTPITKVYCT